MFNRNVDVTVITRMVNEDHFKVQKLMDSFAVRYTACRVFGKDDGTIEVSVTTKKSCIKELTRQVDYLNNLGIKVKIKR